MRAAAARLTFGADPHPALRATFSAREKGAPRRSSLFLPAALLLTASLSGCFQPMYGEAAHPGLVDEVRAIDVQPIDTRIGHYFIEDLRSALNGTGQPVTPKYRLTTKITTSQQTPTVDTQTQTASSATVIGDATFTLVRLSDNKTLSTGTASAAAAYDRTAQRYASLRAARDAEIRLARDLAEEISTRVAARLSDKSI